jgi:hypothetical protein
MSRFSSTQRRRLLSRTSAVPWAGRTSYSVRPSRERTAVASPVRAPTLIHLTDGDALVQGGSFVRLRVPGTAGDVELRLTGGQARALAMALLSASEG